MFSGKEVMQIRRLKSFADYAAYIAAFSAETKLPVMAQARRGFCDNPPVRMREVAASLIRVRDGTRLLS